MVSAGYEYVGGIHASGVVSSAADVLGNNDNDNDKVYSQI